MGCARGSESGIDLLSNPAIAGPLAEGRQAYVAIATQHGPHITPELYAVAGGRLWFFAGLGTLKARTLPRQPAVAVAVPAGSRTVVAGGRVASFHPAALPRHAPTAAMLSATPSALARYCLRNAVDLAGFAADFASGRLGRRLPEPRVLFAVTPERVAVLDGFAVQDRWGDWPGAVADGASEPVHEGAGAVVALAYDGALLAAPVRVDETGQRTQVPAGLLDLAGINATASVEAAVVVDDYGRPGPAAKRGVMLRGAGQLRRDDSGAWLDLDAARAVSWDGIETSTVKAS